MLEALAHDEKFSKFTKAALKKDMANLALLRFRKKLVDHR
jgi:hypothetical protein